MLRFILIGLVAIFAGSLQAAPIKRGFSQGLTCSSSMVRQEESLIEPKAGLYAWVDSIPRRNVYNGQNEMLFLFRIHSPRFNGAAKKLSVGFIFQSPNGSTHGNETTERELTFDSSTKVFYGTVVVPEAGPEGKATIYVREYDEHSRWSLVMQKSLKSFKTQQGSNHCY